MQPTQASKSLAGRDTRSQTSKSRISAQRDHSSRTRNTSGGDSAIATKDGRVNVICDGRVVTPKSLVPSLYQTVTPEGGAGAAGAPGAGGSTAASPVPDGAGTNAGGMGAIPEELPVSPTHTVVHERKPVKAAGLSKEDLERNIDIILAETETETLLNFPSLCVALDNPQSAAVSARNKAYDELCTSKADSDQYKEQHVQTLNHPHKSKEVFAAPPSQENVEVNANGWDIYDTFATDPVPKHEQIQHGCEKESGGTVAEAVKKQGCLFTMKEPYSTGDRSGERHGRRRGEHRSGARRGLGGGVSSAVSELRTSGTITTTKPLGDGHTNGSYGGNSAGGGPMHGGDTATTTAHGGGGGGGANDAGAAGAAEEAGEEAEEAPPPPVDPIPWKVGLDSPIPTELRQQLRVMERIVAQNVFHKQHMIYRNYPTLEELARKAEATAGGPTTALSASESTMMMGMAGLRNSVRGSMAAIGEGDIGTVVATEDGENSEDLGMEETSREDVNTAEKPSLQDLFCFNAPQLTQDMTVTCAEWNRQNQDLLAVSYGDTAPVPTTSGGFVLFWSLKNPTYPERVIRTSHGVTALHFSSVQPNMVAAGTHDGSVMIWDLRQNKNEPIHRSCSSSEKNNNNQKHTDIVWETRWVDQGPDKQPPEILVSVSSDGNVLKWSMKKGLEQMPLMNLKRLPNPQLGANSVYGHKEGIVFRKSSGFCVDFPRHDPSTYLVGTEDGLVHRCSTSYNEQYLDTYLGHSGPVYRVRCNPFMSHAFLTCSADWTMKLWSTKPIPGHQPDSPLLTFQSTDLFDAVNDVTWAPDKSASFAAAMDDGRVELWDLTMKPLDPIVVHYPGEAEAAAAAAGAGGGEAAGTQLPPPPRRRRRRTCVRFSPNSPVLIAGDDKGCVDVMRMYNTDQQYYSEQEQQDRLMAVMMKKR